MKNTQKERMEIVIATVMLASGRFGTPQPQITLTIPSDTHFRLLKAELHKLAAEVELGTPADQDWVVEIETISDHRGRVYLDLIGDNEAEVEAGMKLLQRLRG